MLTAGVKAVGRRGPGVGAGGGAVICPEFVFFDLGNVVFHFDRARAFLQMARLCGIDAELVRRTVMDEGLQEALEAGLIDWAAFHAAYSRLTGTASDPATLAEAASDMFELNVGILPLLAALTRIGMPMGILSNTCDIHWRHLVGGGFAVLPAVFRTLVLSHEIGAAKPDPRIFAAAAGRAATPPARIFFCDDTPGHVRAARVAGWDAEVFTSAADLADQLARRGLTLGL